MMKRILSLLLAFLMVVSILPTPTHAEDTAGGPTAAVTEPACPTCGKSGCTSSHENWCRICLADNCGVDHSKKPAETQASADEAGAINEDEAPHPMVGKIVMLAGTVSYPEVIENPNISVYGSMVGVSAFPERMEIESVVTIGNVDYYQLKAAAGYTWPEYPVSINEYKCYEHHWLKSSQVALAEESEPECPVCGEPGCTAQHKQCEICGKYDCTKFHFWCDRCGKYDCGKSHLICPACGNVDCTKNHVFCGYCGTYNDCEGHDFAPAVEAELPENPVLTEGADVSIVDENGQPATSFRLTEGSKSSISAWSTLDDSSEAAYQWQICYDDENDLWTNIQGQTGKGLLASPAMFQGVLERLGSATVRCVMTVDRQTKTSDPIPVTIAGEQIEMATFARYASAAPAAYAAAPAAEDNENKVNLIINYVFTDGKIAANPRTATLPAGVAYAPATPVTVPDIPGYVPQLGESATDGAAALNGYDLTLSFTAEEMQSDRTVKIVYHPAPVKVVVHHYQQNVDNDNYTLKESEEITLTTGETVGDVHKTYEGFYNLLYEHPVVAADGSTVVDVYYDRYYYLMTFDLSGGYGIDAVYARYGTPIPENPGNAVRPGYTLTHWTLDGYTQPVYKTMPARNTTFVAVWAAQDTAKLTVMYWGENPNDDEYSIINTKELMVEPGSTLQYAPCDRTLHVHNAACYGINSGSASVGAHDIDMYQQMDPDAFESGYVYVTYSGGGRWPYLYLNGRWYSANADMYNFDNYSARIDNYSALNGEILNARKCKANLTLQCTKTEHTHSDSCCTCSTPYHSAEESCGLWISLEDKIWTFDHSDSVTVLPDGSSVLNVYFARKEYTLRFYYAASKNEYSENTNQNITYRVVGGTTWYFGSRGDSTTDEVPLLDRYFVESGDKHNQTGEVANKPTLLSTAPAYTEGTTPGADGNTYYYISFTAKYGANIYNLWPAGVFDKVKCFDHNWANSEYAFVSAWNGEHHVYYSQKNYNETIKGKYAVLDDNLLWDYNQFGAYAEVETDANDNEYNVIDFLCFWENGANVNWSRPSLFRYHIYVEPYEGMDTKDLTSRTWKDKTYYFKEAYDTIDNSIQDNANINQQTYPEIEGFTQLTDYYQKDKNGEAIVGTYEYQRMQSYDTDLYQRAYDMYFYYDRTKYQLQFFNETGVEKTEQVKFERPLASFASYTPSNPVDENGIPIYEAGSHRFAGWYDNPNFEGDPFDFDNTAMPAENIILYAKWTPVHRTVRFFLDKASMDEDKILPEKMAELYAAKNNGENDPNDPYTAKYATLTAVPHGSKITIPETPGVSEGYEDVHPYAGYDFIGWFYLNNNGEETAFDPANMTVTRDLDLYAKWSSNVLCPYEIRYILDANGNGELDADETTAVANPTTGSTLAGNSRTFDAKGDTALYAAYQEGYFPHAASHTIDFKASDEGGVVFTFLYKSSAAVSYTVKYLEKGTDQPLAEEVTYPENKKAVVTENFKVIAGYMPDAYQKSIPIVPDQSNVIIFYYTKDEVHAPVHVVHYIQNVEGDGYSIYQESTDLNTTINNSYSADVMTIEGFNFVRAEANDNKVDPEDGKVTANVPENGLELELYYDRNTFSYKVQYLEYGTDTVLADTVTRTGIRYNQTVTEYAAIEIQKDLDGDGVVEDFQLYEPDKNPLSATILKDGTTLTFYYVRCTQTMTITKQVEDNSAESNPDPDQEFAFTLQIHSNSGYHQSSYAYTKSDNEKGWLAPEESNNKVLNFKLKAGQSITIEGLPTAEYTITEQNLPTGYYDTAGTNEKFALTVEGGPKTVTVTNTYDPALLSIKKTVNVVEDGNVPEVEDFEFTVRGPIGAAGSYSYTVGSEIRTAAVTEGTMTLTLKKSEAATFLNLPTGNYTVIETDYSAKGYNSNYKVNDAADYTAGRTSKLTLERGKTQNVEFMNIFPVGDLTIEKTVNKEFYSTAWNGDTFTFTVERTTENRPLLENNQYMILVDGVEQSAGVVADADGKLTVSIAFSEADAATLTSASSSVKHTLVIKNLPAGTYEVTENSNEEYNQSSQTVDGLVIPAENVKASFTNTVKRESGNLYLEKEMEVLTGYNPPTDVIKFSFTIQLLEVVPENKAYSISYKDKNGKPVTAFTDNTAVPETVTMESGMITVELEVGMNITIAGLPEGIYRITEATVPYYANSFAHKENGSWVAQRSRTTEDGQMFTEIGVTPAATAEVKCTNTYPVDRAELIIQKLVDQEYDRDTLPGGTFTFTVTLDEEDQPSYSYKVYANGSQVKERTESVTNKVFTVVLEAGQYAVIPGMPVCGYTVSETVNTADYNTSYVVYVSDTGDSASTTVPTGAENASGTEASVSRTFSAGKTDAIVFTNEYTRHLGTLTITKTGAEAIDENQSFVFTVTSGSISIPVVLNSENHFEATLSELPFGTYTITEDSSWSWRYTLDANQPGSAEINAQNLDVTVEIANVRTKTKWLNGAAFESNWFTASTK